MDNKTTHLLIISPENTIFDEDIKSIILKSSQGELGILPNHADFIALIKPCILRIHTLQDNIVKYEVNGGILEVRSNKIKILTEKLPIIHKN